MTVLWREFSNFSETSLNLQTMGSWKTAYRTKAKAAVTKGIDCILRTQIKQSGKLTAWCAQHDEKKRLRLRGRVPMKPPSISGAESVGIVRFPDVNRRNPHQRLSPLSKVPLNGLGVSQSTASV